MRVGRYERPYSSAWRMQHTAGQRRIRPGRVVKNLSLIALRQTAMREADIGGLSSKDYSWPGTPIPGLARVKYPDSQLVWPGMSAAGRRRLADPGM